MAKNKKKKVNFPSTPGNSLLIALLVIFVLLIILFFVYWRMFFGFRLGEIFEEATPGDVAVESTSSSTSQTVKLDPALVGTWESDCLVPDAGSPWSEKHHFIINSDGIAQHTRWSSSGHACSHETTMVDKYTVSTPLSGQIDFKLIEGTGPASGDIYQVAGNTLLFGHGFRNNLPYGEGTLNQYIVYKKKN